MNDALRQDQEGANRAEKKITSKTVPNSIHIGVLIAGEVSKTSEQKPRRRQEGLIDGQGLGELGKPRPRNRLRATHGPNPQWISHDCRRHNTEELLQRPTLG